MCIVVKILRAEGLAQERDVVMKVAPGNRPPAALHDKKIVKYKPWNSTNTARQTSLAFCLEAFSRSTCAYVEHCGLRELSQHEIGTWGSWGRTCSSEMTFRHLQRSLQSLLRLHLYLGNSQFKLQAEWFPELTQGQDTGVPTTQGKQSRVSMSYVLC